MGYTAKLRTLLCGRLVPSIMNHIRHSALYALREDLLDLLGHDRILAVVQGMRLAGRLACGAAGGMNLLCALARSLLCHLEWVSPTLSGNASSRPFGAASCTDFGTALWPCAWDFPWPYSFADIFVVDERKRVCWKAGRAIVRSLRANGMMKILYSRNIGLVQTTDAAGRSLCRTCEWRYE